MDDKIKEEFINRYNFLFRNVDLILMSRLKNDNNKFYLSVDKHFLDSLELFLLGDIPWNETNFYKDICNLRNNSLVYDNCMKLKKYLDDLRKQKYVEYYDIKTIFQIVRNYVLGQKKGIFSDNKLLTLDEYFRFNRYNNSSFIIKGGAILGYADLGIFCERLRNYDSPYKYKRSFLLSSNFIQYISDKNNHYEDNNSIFTEDEKQKVYIENHPGVIPWNKKDIKVLKK